MPLEIDFLEELKHVIEENNVIKNNNKDCGIFEKNEIENKIKDYEIFEKIYN